MVRLRDELISLDEPLTITVGGRKVFEGKVKRTATAVRDTLDERADPDAAATAQLVLNW
jgi:hypothetical protein